MRVEPIEIYSDASNYAVLRQPGRRFPGTLVQGDSLHVLCRMADTACLLISHSAPGYAEMNDLRNALWERLNHYKTVLNEHGIPLPFDDQPTDC